MFQVYVVKIVKMTTSKSRFTWKMTIKLVYCLIICAVLPNNFMLMLLLLI